MKRLWLLLATLVWVVTVPAATDEATMLVKETSERMLQVLAERRSEVDRDPRLIYQLIDRIVLPHFDFERITRGAVGRYWQQATAAQRDALVAGFREVLVRTYARALLEYSGQPIRYLPLRPGQDVDLVTVATEVDNPGGRTLSVDYRLYRRGEVWKVYDVAIDNVSLVANYRSSFASIVRSNGIAGLIARLDEMNRSGQK